MAIGVGTSRWLSIKKPKLAPLVLRVLIGTPLQIGQLMLFTTYSLVNGYGLRNTPTVGEMGGTQW